MSPWVVMVKKDIRALRRRWMISVGILLMVGIAIGLAASTGSLKPGVATAVGTVFVIANVFVMPVNLFRGLASEMRRSPSLWLQTPQSGWAMLASKLLSSLIGSVLFLVTAYLLTLWMFHIDLQKVRGILTEQQVGHVSLILEQIPRLGLYGAVALLFFGLYIAMWVGTAYMSVRAVRSQLRKFSWLVGAAVLFIATWGLGAFERTALYQSLFGWGQFTFLSLFPPDVQAAFPKQNGTPITMGHLVFDVIVIAVLFYVTGRLIDRHVEV